MLHWWVSGATPQCSAHVGAVHAHSQLSSNRQQASAKYRTSGSGRSHHRRSCHSQGILSPGWVLSHACQLVGLHPCSGWLPRISRQSARSAGTSGKTDPSQPWRHLDDSLPAASSSRSRKLQLPRESHSSLQLK